MGDREPGQGLGDLRPESAHAQPDVEHAAIGSPAPLDPYLPSPSKTQPIDNLAPLAKAGVPILHDCGSLDPWLKDNTRVVEKRYKELGGKITVLVTEGEGHFPVSRKDPKPVVDFI